SVAAPTRQIAATSRFQELTKTMQVEDPPLKPVVSADHLKVEIFGPEELRLQLHRLESPFVEGAQEKQEPLAQSVRWLRVLQDGLGHEPFLLRTTSQGRLPGALPLSLVRSRLFGRYLVSLPYVNSA